MNVIPESDRIALVVRHSDSVQQGDDYARTLTQVGTVNAQFDGNQYRPLLQAITTQFGEPTFYSSTMIRSAITCWELFQPDHIKQDERLDVTASLKKIQGGAWFKGMKDAGKTTPEIIRAFIDDKSLWVGQPFEEYVAKYLAIITEGTERFKVIVGHEVAISLAAGMLANPDDLGLEERQAFAFFLKGNTILGVQKIVPESSAD